MTLPVHGSPDSTCNACVIVPVCNEEHRLPACLDALHNQTINHCAYEVIFFLNNCTDGSARIARAFQESHPNFRLRLIEKQLPKSQANVGTVRRLLMDEASKRLPAHGAILSTDGDSQVAPDWVLANLNLLQDGLDAVGGHLHLQPEDYALLPTLSRGQHEADHIYRRAESRLESLLDPNLHDPWPRHHHHFGASLACTNSFYKSLEGLPAVDCLEDVEFVKAVTRADGRLRHSLAVNVVTSARISGRARIGLSSQLREWQAGHMRPLVDTAGFLRTYFGLRAELRTLWTRGVNGGRRLEAVAALVGIRGWLFLPNASKR